MLLAYRATSPLAGLKELPSRMLIARWGENRPEAGKQPFVVNDKTARYLPVLQKALGFDTIALDFEHNTVPGTPAFAAEPEPKNVAAHGRPVVVPGEGLYAEDLRWTPHGEKSVKEGLHPDLSPTIKTADDDSVVFVHSAALCRQGSVPDLQVFSATFTPDQLATLSATLSSTATQPTMDFKKLLLLLLGLDANSSDADIETACKKFAEANDGKKIETYSASLKSATDQIAALAQRLDAQERATITADAIRAGKLIPNSAAELNLEQFRKLVS
jgi:phage I-like protein